MTTAAIAAIIARFNIAGKIMAAVPFGSGHINDTFCVSTDTGNQYLLQKINHHVFRDVPGLMNNLTIVTRHLKQKLAAFSGADPEKEVLTLIETKDGSCFLQDAAGSYWRMFVFLSGTKSYDEVLTERQAAEGGKAFGRFQALLADLDPQLFIDTIPDFHNIAYRLANLDVAIAADITQRLSGVKQQIAFIDHRRQQMGSILRQWMQGIIQRRIIHNDTKFNNVLLDEHDNAQCVIDLDTVMPGFLAYDFGDAIRTIINAAPEDEPDLRLITLKIPFFAAYVKGYLKEAAGFITETEVSSLIFGVLLLPFMQGVRFLTDHLEGDRYFKISFPGHNLQRARAQFRLVEKLEEAKETLNKIILHAWNDKAE